MNSIYAGSILLLFRQVASASHICYEHANLTAFTHYIPTFMVIQSHKARLWWSLYKSQMSAMPDFHQSTLCHVPRQGKSSCWACVHLVIVWDWR